MWLKISDPSLKNKKILKNNLIQLYLSSVESYLPNQRYDPDKQEWTVYKDECVTVNTGVSLFKFEKNDHVFLLQPVEEIWKKHKLLLLNQIPYTDSSGNWLLTFFCLKHSTVLQKGMQIATARLVKTESLKGIIHE